MPRNLYNRVELITPVDDEANREQLADVLDRAFADNTNSWQLGSDGVWSRCTTNGDPPRSMQAELLERHAKLAEEAALVSG
jgi:polyphosphate kinase